MKFTILALVSHFVFMASPALFKIYLIASGNELVDKHYYLNSIVSTSLPIKHIYHIYLEITKYRGISSLSLKGSVIIVSPMCLGKI